MGLVRIVDAVLYIYIHIYVCACKCVYVFTKRMIERKDK